MIQQRCTTTLTGQEAACTALPHSLHSDVVCDRVLRSPRCVGKAVYHRWTPALLSCRCSMHFSPAVCAVYITECDHLTGHLPWSGERKRKMFVYDREKCLFGGLSKHARVLWALDPYSCMTGLVYSCGSGSMRGYMQTCLYLKRWILRYAVTSFISDGRQ